jgi:hypothetical protein
MNIIPLQSWVGIQPPSSFLDIQIVEGAFSADSKNVYNTEHFKFFDFTVLFPLCFSKLLPGTKQGPYEAGKGLKKESSHIISIWREKKTKKEEVRERERERERKRERERERL